MTNALHDARPATWAPDDSTFGARLAMLRQHMRWGNVAEAARQCGLPVESWRNWEEGKRPRDLTEVAKAIADRTGCDVYWLVWGPSRAQLEARIAVTKRERQVEEPIAVQIMGVPAVVYPEPIIPVQRRRMTAQPPHGPVATTRPVQQTRPLVHARQPVSLPALS